MRLTSLFQAVRNRFKRHTEPVPAVNEPVREPVAGRGNVPLCTSTNKRGKPCRGIAVGGSGRCLAHQPGGRERMAKIGRRGGLGRRQRSEAEMAVAAGMADSLATQALLEVVQDPYASQTNVVRAAEAIWAQAQVVRDRTESSYRTSPAATGSQGPLPGQVYSTSQSETPEHTFDAASAAPVASEAPSVPEARLEDYAWLEWKRLHPGGRPYRPRRGRSRSPYADYDKLETG